MRAERLLAVLMLLKTHSRMTAAQLADELDVSERTVLRDIDALSLSGIPVYAERGRHGGFALLPGYRTDLSGLTLDEARTLVAGGGRLDSPAFASAMRKVAASLPDAFRTSAVRAAQRILVRPEGFVHPPREIDALGPVQQAVFDGRRIRVRYRRRGAERAAERVLDPIGLIVAGDTWYLVATTDGTERMYRMSRMSDVEILDEPAARADDVDLEEIWQRHRAEFRAGFTEVPVMVRASPETASALRGIASEIASSALPDGRVELTLGFMGEGHAVNALWTFVADVEVRGPVGVRSAMVERVRAMAQVYLEDDR